MTALLFIIVLAVLIFVHELGHFMAARACGIRVDAFKLGFGPKICSWRRGETEYGINWIPFGGYVKIHGEDAAGAPGAAEGHASTADQGRMLTSKPRIQQAFVMVAGVAMNFAFAWVLYTAVFMTGVTASTDGFEAYAEHMSDRRVMISSVLPGSPANAAGLKVGDIISGAAAPEDVQSMVQAAGGEPVVLQYIREGQLRSATLVPAQGLVAGRYAVGIAMDEVARLRLPVFASLREGLNYTVGMIGMTAAGLYDFFADIVRGQPDVSAVAGPIGIAVIVGDAASFGFSQLLMITALISINLGVINLIPFPALDGGRLLFVAVEGILRRRIPPVFANTVNLIGFAVLMILMLAVTWKDVSGLVFGGIS